uniref:Uncharacterized protein n=1 Tax=Timema bartmani TaxID=61472 RepID=A0A7R9HZD6_9NEOP|nr:unnamed protein product [Timema bartmani]
MAAVAKEEEMKRWRGEVGLQKVWGDLMPLALSRASLKHILWDGQWEGERHGMASQPTKVSFRPNKKRWTAETVDGASYQTGLAEKSYEPSTVNVE